MELESIRIFVKVVQLSSFSRAAELLKLPKSTVSRTIARLESDSGTRLLYRTTRSLTPTAAGLAFYESCVNAVQTLEDAGKSLSGSDNMLSGVVRITAPEDIGAHIVSAAAGNLLKEHRGLSFNLHYTDELVDLVKEGFDLAIRIGKLKSSGIRARKVGEVALILVASPEYLKSHGQPLTPEELGQHDCMTFTFHGAQARWTLQSKGEEKIIPIHTKVISNQMTSLVNVATQGGGIALVPPFLCAPLLASGQLIRVLDHWTGASIPVSIVSPLGVSKSIRLKLITDQLADALQKTLNSMSGL